MDVHTLRTIRGDIEAIVSDVLSKTIIYDNV